MSFLSRIFRRREQPKQPEPVRPLTHEERYDIACAVRTAIETGISRNIPMIAEHAAAKIIERECEVDDELAVNYKITFNARIPKPGATVSIKFEPFRVGSPE